MYSLSMFLSRYVVAFVCGVRLLVLIDRSLLMVLWRDDRSWLRKSKMTVGGQNFPPPIISKTQNPQQPSAETFIRRVAVVKR